MTRLSKRTKRISTAIAVVAIVGGTAGAAYAYWLSSGSGSGTVATGHPTAFTVAEGTPTGGALTPGGVTDTIPFTVTNPSTGVQHLTNVVVTVANPDGTAWTAVSGCSNADYSVGTPVITYGDIAANSGTLAGTVTVTMNNLGSNQVGCIAASAPLYFAAS
jgi:hypothetical protein